MSNAYAIAHLRTPQINDDVLEYIERIQATLDPFGGRFIVHGADVDVREGPWPGTVVVIEFPDADAARAWWKSDEYAPLKAMRQEASDTNIVLVEGA